MSYIGNAPISAAFLTDTFSGTGSQVAYTMTVAPANTSSIIVAVTGVLQDPSTYSVSGTTLTFSAAPPTGTSNISVRYLGIPASGVTTTAYRTVTDFTATAGQTSFSVPSYTVGYIDVYRNGVRLTSTDYTATTGTTVVLTNACTVGDAVVTESFYVSSVLNAIPATAGAVNSTYIAAGAVGNTQMAAGAARANFGAGAVLQVVYTSKPSTFVGTSVLDNGAYFIDVTSLSATITPVSASSKILIFVTLYIGSTTVSSGYQQAYRIKRTIGGVVSFPILGDAEGGRPRGTGRVNMYIPTAYSMVTLGGTHQDTPSTTSAITYQIQLGGYSGSPIVYLNRGESFQNDGAGNNYDVVPISALTLMEIAG